MKTYIKDSVVTEDRRNMLTVSQLNEYVKMIMDSDSVLSDVYIRGEVSNFKNHYSSGHYYMTIKDNDCSLRAVMFRAYASKLKFIPENGMKIVAHGRISVFPRDGEYQLYIDSIQPDGEGALYYAFEQLKAKLEKEGLFDDERKKSIPTFPRKIGIVTSPTGAAVQDMINVISRRYPLGEIVIYPVQVQGPSAPGELIAGIEYFNTIEFPDTIIIGRGGGSIEDLWAFNNENLARTVAASKIPVVSAVGHEIDYTLTDFVADLRAPTPSAAAELVVPDVVSLISVVENYNARISVFLDRLIEIKKQQLERLRSSRLLKDPYIFIYEKTQTVLRYKERIISSYKTAVDKKRANVNERVSELNALNPLSVLTRGYAVLIRDGQPVTSVKEVAEGDEIQIRVNDGIINALIKGTEEDIINGKEKF